MIYLKKCSKGIVHFLYSVGYRKEHCITTIPGWIWSNKNYTNPFIRGLFDTDGSLALKKNHGRYKFYPVVRITLKDRTLLLNVQKWIKIKGLNSNVSNESYFDKRTMKVYRKWGLQVSGYNNTRRWIDLIGSSNPKHIEKYGTSRI